MAVVHPRLIQTKQLLVLKRLLLSVTWEISEGHESSPRRQYISSYDFRCHCRVVKGGSKGRGCPNVL